MKQKRGAKPKSWDLLTNDGCSAEEHTHFPETPKPKISKKPKAPKSDGKRKKKGMKPKKKEESIFHEVRII